MFPLILSNSLMLCTLLLAFCSLTTPAPTHHLTIGVQGNTPTLIVTSSEIGISPELLNPNKKSLKLDVPTKPQKVLKSNEKLKPLKQKVHKNFSLNHKKEKLPSSTKPIGKQLSVGEATMEKMHSLSRGDNNLKHFKESFEHQTTTAAEHREKEIENISTVTFKKDINLKINSDSSSEQLKSMIGTSMPTTTIPPKENIDNKKTFNVTSQTLPRAKEIKTILEVSTSAAMEKPDIATTTTTTTTSARIREEKHKQAKTLRDISTTAGSFPQTNSNLELSELLDSRKINDISSTTNYDVTFLNTAFTLEALKTSSTLKAISTSEITEETTTIQNENNNDRTTENSTILKNENLLLTSTPAMTKTFTPPPTPSFATFKPDNAAATTSMPLLAISLTTMPTTSAYNNDDNEHNAAETSETATNMKKADNYVNGKAENDDGDDDDDDDATLTIHGDYNKSVKFKQDPTYEIAIKANFVTATSLSHTAADKTMTTENSSPSAMIAETMEDFQTNAPENEQSVIITETDMETTAPTTLVPLTEQKQQQQQPTTEISMDSLEITTTPSYRVNDERTTTEKVLKLIDLEKHVVASIGELKQPSLTVESSQDNGHDGLKNIKKKQLIEKHYIEDLLLNKHDDNHKRQNLKQENVTENPSFSSTTTLSHLTDATSANHLLVPIKHGYLGPILMEEKTFHVIHHAAKNSNEMLKNNQPKSFFETQLRSGHFVELKAKSDEEPKLEISKNSLEAIGQNDHQKFVKSSIENKHEFLTIPKQTDETNSQNGFQEVISHANQNKYEAQTKTSPLGSSIFYTIPNKQFVENPQSATVLSSTLFQIIDTMATKTPIVQANTTFTSQDTEQTKDSQSIASGKGKTESKISDIQIEVYDSTIDSIVGSTKFKDNENNPIYLESINDELSQGKTTKPPVSSVQQEKFTQYVIDRTETSTQESINFSRIQVASGKPEPAAIEIHINVSESFGNESEDLEFSYPQSEYNNNERVEDESYDESKVSDNIKLKVPSNGGSNSVNKEARSDEILVVEIIDTDNTTEQTNRKNIKNTDDLFMSDNTPPPPPPPPPYQTNFDRDSDTIFYISNTEVKVGESLANTKTSNEERKLKLESQFFPANYMASTHPNVNTKEDSKSIHHLYEEDIILSSNSNRNQADSLKIYRNLNEPSPPLDVTYVGESIIEVEQSPDAAITTTYVPDQQHLGTQQADVIIQPAILPEISIGVPVIGELPPQIELKEIDFMPNEAQLHRSGIYDENDSSNSNNNNNNIYNNDIDDNTINAGSSGYSFSHDVDNSNNNNNQRLDESSIQYGGDLIDESADGGFDGVEGSYPFGNPAAAVAASSSGMTTTHKQQPTHVADYAHLYVNYGVNNMRKDELSADVKDSGELIALGVDGGSSSSSTSTIRLNSNEQNLTSFKEFLNRISLNNSSFINGNATQTERMSNATAFSVMEDANDLQEKNTEDIVNLISLAIGLFIVILPIVVTCSMFWALRYLYKKYHSNITDSSGYSDQTDTKGQMNEDVVEKGELGHDLRSSSLTNSDKDAIQKFPDSSNKPSTTDSTVKFSTENSTHLDQTTSSNCGSTLSASKAKFSLQLSLALETHSPEFQTVHDVMEMPGPNGSITKMTLENNLLIVETEERNDISRVARETKMDYNKDGVFVVEVSRGIDSKTIPESPVAEDSEKMLSMFETKHNNGVLGYKVANEKSSLNNEKVQIHSPPPENSAEEGPRSLHQIEEVDEPINSPHFYGDEDADIIAGLAYKSNAGLSQSDLSTTSSNDSNKGYSYGNQALYVVEQNGYSTMSPTGNVVLKCDTKDVNDEDHNPENDHYLEHSPDKTDERRDRDRDFVETVKKQENSRKGTDQGVSPQQKQNDKDKETERKDVTYKEVEILNVVNIEVEQLSEYVIANKKEEVFLNESSSHSKPTAVCVEDTLPDEYTAQVDLDIPLEIPVSENSSTSLPIESSSPIKSSKSQELILCDATYSMTETSLSVESPREESLSNDALPLMVETVLMVEETITNGDSILDVPEKFSDYCQTDNDKSITVNNTTTEIIAEKEQVISENGFEYTEKIALTINGVEEKIKPVNSDEESRTENKLNLLAEDKIAMNGFNHQTDIKTLANDSETLQSVLQQNSETDTGPLSNALTDMENGYDSIMSLPEPPPNTDEHLSSDLSEQQLDSLPPPPPPEIFNLKDLPPPQINGDTDSLPSDESINFYNTLPPPPPTTLEVTGTNGRMHASPLTPPASPPARFTNNLHAELCAQSIAVDVNGS